MQVGPLAGGPGVRGFVTVPLGRRTLLEHVRHGAVDRWAVLHGAFGVPGATVNGDGTGLSADGRTLVLAGFGYPTRRTRLAVVDAFHLRVTGRLTLRGDFAVDAVSPRGRWLYLTRYHGPNNPFRYEVRAYDLRARKLLPKPIVDPREPDEKMQGMPMVRTTSADGRWVYTLYQAQQGSPFVHALDTARRRAACIDLPMFTSVDGLRLKLDGRTLHVGPALVDTRTFAARMPRRAASASVTKPGGGVPWALLVIAAPLVLAGLAALRQAVAASPSASKSSA
jgi:hypothetical protein